MHKSNDLFETAKKYIPGGVNSPVRAFRSVGGTPFFTKRAEGPFLYTADDERLTDFVCTWGPALHGHNHPEIKEAIQVAGTLSIPLPSGSGRRLERRRSSKSVIYYGNPWSCF